MSHFFIDIPQIIYLNPEAQNITFIYVLLKYWTRTLEKYPETFSLHIVLQIKKKYLENFRVFRTNI